MVLSQRIEHQFVRKSRVSIINDGGQSTLNGGQILFIA